MHRPADQDSSPKLLHLLLLVAVCEFSVYRLVAPALKPTKHIPLWHTALEGFGLFLSYFAALLAAGLVCRMLWRMVTEGSPYNAPVRWLLFFSAGMTAALATYSMFADATDDTSMLLRIYLLIMLVSLLAGLVSGLRSRRYSWRGVAGIALMVLPLLLALAPFLMLVLGQQDTRYSDFEPRMNELSFEALVVAGIAMPLCFAPRPILRSLTSTGPLTISLVVSLMGALILRQHFEVGWRLAERGLSLDLGPGIPADVIALAVVALGAVAWTLATCYMAPSRARGEIGIGISLVIMGGLIIAGGFPARYLLTVAGLLVLGDATTRVREQEQHLGDGASAGFAAPPISADAWQRYVHTLVAHLRGDSSNNADGSAVTVGGEAELVTTHVVTMRDEVQVRVSVWLRNGSITGIDVSCGTVSRFLAEMPEPGWTMYARPERTVGQHAHPHPPSCPRPAHTTGDASFDRRFAVRGSAAATDELMNDQLRSRATSLLDGWIAFWPEHGLLYRVHPGRGAPLDHPIPITELAFRGEDADLNVDRLVGIIDLLAAIAARALPADKLRAPVAPDDLEG